MSQMASTARAGARPLNRPVTETPRLRVVTGAPLRRSGATFGIICATLLAAGLIGLLLLNTTLAQGSFTLHDLRTTSDALTDTEGTLNQSLEVLESPANLAVSATKMGMVPSPSTAFLRLSDGAIIGVATPATAMPGLTVVGTTGSASATAVATSVKSVPAPVATRPVRSASVAARAAKSAKR